MRTSIVSKKHVKLYALACAEHRAHKFSRVSREFLDRADAALRNWIVREVHALPSKGKTIR